MNAKTMVAQAKKLSNITKFVFGEKRYISIQLDCVHTSWKPEMEVGYSVYISVPRSITPNKDGYVTFVSNQWKDVLSLITWLEGIEVPKPVRYLDR